MNPIWRGGLKYFNDTGVSLLRRLVQRKSEKLARLDQEIKNIRDKLAPSINSEEYKECSKNLLKTLEKED